MKHLLSLAFLCLIIIHSPAQILDKDLLQLLKERDSLYKQVSYYEKQTNSFWGTQSKRDLRAVIETLKEIISKDTEIVQAIRVAGNQKNNNLYDKNKESYNRIAELEQALSAAQGQAKVRQQQLQKAELELKSRGTYKYKYHGTVLIIIILVISQLFQFYFIWKRRRAPKLNHNL